MSYKEAFKKTGLTADKVSVSLQKKIKQYEKDEAEIAEKKKAAESLTGDAKVEALKVIESLDDDLKNVDADLSEKIFYYHKNRDMYLAKAEAMNKAKALAPKEKKEKPVKEKKEKKEKEVVVPEVIVPAEKKPEYMAKLTALREEAEAKKREVADRVVPTPVAAEPIAAPQPAAPVVEEKKKSNTVAYVFLGLLVAGLTLGAVQLYKNRS